MTGGRPLHGRATVQGGKNTALHLYAATQLTDEPVTLTNAPAITDTAVYAAILTLTGTPATFRDGVFRTRPPDEPPDAPAHLVVPDRLGRRTRITPVLAAGLLARAGRVRFPLPGGDAFCHRPIDRHLAAMAAAGAELELDRGQVTAQLAGPLRPFSFDANTSHWGPSLGATVTALLLAARAPGTSTIHHPSVEPEILAVAELLTRCGLDLDWSPGRLLVTGADRLGGAAFAVPPDRTEAATLALAVAATGGTLHLTGFPGFTDGLRAALTAAGLRFTPEHGGTTVTCPDGPQPLHLATGPHPAFPTDVQPQLTAFLTQAPGTSTLTERVFAQRSDHIRPLAALGAALHADGPSITVHGRTPLRAAEVHGTDIRTATALLLAALAAEGTSTLHGLHHLRRGHAGLLSALTTLGARLVLLDPP
nr:UDP-N-acetylglucosamine 1-carboxyvinyltransferase [Kitasatospora sp. MMS16-BH015]